VVHGAGAPAVGLLRRQRSLRGRHAHNAWIRTRGHRDRARERFERCFDHVVGVFSITNLEVQVAERGAREATEELTSQLGIEAADPASLQHVGVIDQRRPTPEIHRGRRQRLVHRDGRLPESSDSAPVPQRFSNRLSQTDTDILDGVMGVDLHVASRLDLQIEQPVTAEGFQHVGEKRDGRVDAALTLAIEVQSELDLRLGGVSYDFRTAHQNSILRDWRYNDKSPMAKPFRSPLVGYNHNLNHRGRVFHVQTEDSGPAMPRLFTHLFYEGTILVSAKHQYDRDLPDDQVRALMRAQHKTVIKDLMQARLDERIIAFFAARGEELIPVPGAVPQSAVLESSGSVMVLPPVADNPDSISDSGAGRDADGAAGTSATVEVAPDDRSQAYADVQVGPSSTDIPVAVGPRRTTTRPIEASQQRPDALPASVPAPAPAPVPIDRRPAFIRGRSPVISPPSSGDSVVVQRNVVVGGTSAPSARPARIRPPVPYVVMGGGHTDRLPKTTAASGSAAPPKAMQQKTVRPPAAQLTNPPSITPSAAAGSAPSTPSGPGLASAVGTPRSKTGFGVGRTDDKSLDEVILEYLSEDGEPG
jgi:hypothetical protein